MDKAIGFNLPPGIAPTQQRFSRVDDALKMAATLPGSEAVVQNTDKNGQTYFTLKPVSEHEVQQYDSSQYDPSIIKFSIDKGNGTTPTGAERILKADALSTRNALENGLKSVIPPQVYGPASLNKLSQGLGFKDFDAMYQLISKLPPEKQEAFVQTLTRPESWKSVASDFTRNLLSNPLNPAQAFENTRENLVENLKGPLNEVLQSEIKGLFEGQGAPNFDPPLESKDSNWSPAALLGIHNSLQNIKENSPADFSRIQSTDKPFTFKFEADPTLSSEDTNIAAQDPLKLITDSMKIAHTSCNCGKDHSISIREGAVKGSSDAILNEKILNKLTLFSRGTPATLNKIQGFPDGSNQWYKLDEMQDRGMVSGNPPALDREKSLKLLGDLNKAGSSKDQTWRLLNSLGNSAGVFQPKLLKNDPVLKDYLKPNSAGLDMNKLWNVFFPQGNQAEIAKIQTAVQNCLGQASNQTVANAVFKMEQMNQTQGLQDFLNTIKPDMARDLLKDGNIGPRTQNAIKRMEGILALNTLKKNLPQPLSPQQNHKVQDIFNSLTAPTLDEASLAQTQTKMKALLQEIPNRIVQESPQKTLHEVMGNLIERMDGKFNQQTSKDLVNSWLSIVDSEGEGNVISDLVTHEVGHNLMEIFKQDHPQINLERDWAAISGKADQKGPDQFTMAPATQSYFNQAPEEVSDYGETNPGEDFAESYRMFMSQPEELIKRAPTKFLVLNALNGRFSPEQIQTQFGPYQDKLDQAWKKIQGQTGAKFHLSAPMVELMNKTYGGTLGKPADSSDLQSFTTAALDKAGKTVAGTGALYKNPPLSPERLQSLKNLQHPALSQEQLKATNNALAKLISQVQTGGGNLDATGIQTLLGNDYQALPEGFKAMLSDPNSFISQYLSQPNHVGRSASPGWVQTEALSQMVTGYENLNSNYVRLAGLSSEGGGGGLKGLFMFKSKGGGPALLPVTRELNAYLENYNRLRQPAVPVPDSEALKAKVSEILSQTQTPTEFMARFLQEMGLQ